MTTKIEKSDEEWRKELTPEQYSVLRKKGTEAPHTGKYVHTMEPGAYRCAACGEELFDSEAKFISSCGWPSFSAPTDEDNIDFHEDRTFFMKRVEVTCKSCGSHLGHVFNDGPGPTGLRYCINSVSLELDKSDSE